MNLAQHVGTLNLLGDESRIRLCALLRERELCVTDLVRVTGIAQSRVSTHLGRLREAGFVRDRRQGAQSFYALASDDACPARQRWSSTRRRARPIRRWRATSGACSSSTPSGAAACPSRSPARSSATTRRAAPGSRSPSGSPRCCDLGDVLDVGSGDGAAASSLAPYCRSLTCIDTNAAHDRGRDASASASTPTCAPRSPTCTRCRSRAASFDAVLVFHTLTYAEQPGARARGVRARAAPGRAARPPVLDEHEQHGGHRAATASATPASRRAPLRAPAHARRARRCVSAEVACREAKKPHFQVVLAIADKPTPTGQLKNRATTESDPMSRIRHRPPAREAPRRSASPSSTARWARPSAPTG